MDIFNFSKVACYFYYFFYCRRQDPEKYNAFKKKNEGAVKLHGTFKIVEKNLIERVCTDTKKLKIVVSYLEGQLDK